MSGVALELIAQDSTAVRVAADIGARRVELCTALALGGLTPSLGTIERAVAAAGSDVEVHVLIRARPGGFRYTRDEVATMVRDVRAAVAAGAAGVVVGALDDAGRFDLDAMRALGDAARTSGAGVAAHRAIDVSADPLAALDDLIGLGVDRVLTSGAAPTAIAGADMLRALVARSAGRITVMAGSGVDAASVHTLLATGVTDLHFSAKRTVTDRSGVSMGAAETDGVGSYDTVDPALARAVALAVRAEAGR